MFRYVILHIVLILLCLYPVRVHSALVQGSGSSNGVSVDNGNTSLRITKDNSSTVNVPSVLKRKKTPELSNKEWKITADTMLSAVDSTVIEAKDNVTISNGEVTLRADSLRYFTQTGWIYLRGSVRLVFDDNATIHADEAEINRDTLAGWMYNATIQLENPFVRVTGAVVERKGVNSYLFKNATVTSCDAEIPPWEFFARLIDVRIDGYTVLYDSTLNLFGVSALSIPTTILPSNVSRQTGFLFPEVGMSSSKGFGVTIPFYWAIDKNSDLLTTLNIMSKKGAMLGAKYRGWYTPEQKVWLAGNWIYETNLENLTSPVTNNTYTPDQNRYWLRGMFDTPIGKSRWNFQATIDYASDLSFVSDYKSGMMGANASFNEAFNFFGREFNPVRQNRVSEAVISTSYNRFGIAFSARYEEDLLSSSNTVDKNIATATQTLPAAELFLYRQRLLGASSLSKYIPIEVETDLGTSYFLREAGTKGMRVNFSPKLFVPFQFDYLSITPSVKLNQRAYFATDNSGISSNAPKQEQAYVFIPEYTVDMESNISRAYAINSGTQLKNAGESKWAGIMHTIKPWVQYKFRDFVDQSKTPEYTTLDRLEATNAFTYGVTTSLVRKKESLAIEVDDNNTAKLVTEKDYLRFLTLTVQQTYFPSIAHTQYKYNLSPVEMEIKYYYSTALSFRTFMKVDAIYGNLVRTDVTMEYIYKKFKFALGYDYQEYAPHYYQEAKINSIYTEIETPVIYSMQGRIKYAHDIVRDKPSEITAELRYVGQCFSIGLSYSQDFFDTSVGLLFSIPVMF